MSGRRKQARTSRGSGGTELAATSRPKMLKIGEVAKLSGVGVEALRFYERSGLLDAPSRTESGYRVYDARVLERLDFIKRSQTLGFTLDEIKRVIDDRRAGRSPCAEVRAIVRRRLGEIEERLEQMTRYRDELARVFEAWEQRGDASGVVCGLIEDSSLAGGVEEPIRRKRTRGGDR